MYIYEIYQRYQEKYIYIFIRIYLRYIYIYQMCTSVYVEWAMISRNNFNPVCSFVSRFVSHLHSHASPMLFCCTWTVTIYTYIYIILMDTNIYI